MSTWKADYKIVSDRKAEEAKAVIMSVWRSEEKAGASGASTAPKPISPPSDQDVKSSKKSKKTTTPSPLTPSTSSSSSSDPHPSTPSCQKCYRTHLHCEEAKAAQKIAESTVKKLEATVRGLEKSNQDAKEQMEQEFREKIEKFEMDMEALRQENARLLEQLEGRNAPAPPAPANEDECMICFFKVLPHEQMQCATCTASLHTQCFLEWLEVNPSCPVCRIAMAHPLHFPPLQ